MRSPVQNKFRVELWAEGELYCWSQVTVPEGLNDDEGFDWVLRTTLEKGGWGFEIKIIPLKIAANRSVARNK